MLCYILLQHWQKRLFDKQPQSMPFQKGRSGNPKGRPKDPVATSIRESLQGSINIERLTTALEELQGLDFINGMSKILPFILPRLKEVVVVNVDSLQESIKDLSDKDLAKLSTELINEYERRPNRRVEEGK